MDQGKRSPSAVLLVGWFAIFLVFTIVWFFRPWRPAVATTEGEGIDGVLNYLLFSTGALCIVGHIVLCWFIWKSTRPAPAERDDYRAPSSKVQWLWGILPVAVMSVIAEAGVLIAGTPVWKDLFIDRPKDPVVIEVVGKQFEWWVRYPGLKDGEFGAYQLKWVDSQENPLGLDEDDDKAQDDFYKRDELYVPVGRPIELRMRSYDVIHSFFVPAFRVKQDLIPGITTRIKFTPTKTGTYELACAELCGLGHYQMRGLVHVLEPAEYEAKLRELSERYSFGG